MEVRRHTRELLLGTLSHLSTRSKKNRPRRALRFESSVQCESEIVYNSSRLKKNWGRCHHKKKEEDDETVRTFVGT